MEQAGLSRTEVDAPVGRGLGANRDEVFIRRQPIDRVVDDITKRGAETYLESEGDIILILDRTRNQERNISGGQDSQFLVLGGGRSRCGRRQSGAANSRS